MSKKQVKELEDFRNALIKVADEIGISCEEMLILWIAYHTSAIHQHLEQLVYKNNK